MTAKPCNQRSHLNCVRPRQWNATLGVPLTSLLLTKSIWECHPVPWWLPGFHSGSSSLEHWRWSPRSYHGPSCNPGREKQANTQQEPPSQTTINKKCNCTIHLLNPVKPKKTEYAPFVRCQAISHWASPKSQPLTAGSILLEAMGVCKCLVCLLLLLLPWYTS